MQGKKKILAAARLYLVLDRQVAEYQALFDIVKAAVPAGVDIVQLRDKEGCAAEIMDFSRRVLCFLRGKVPYIINDRADVAKTVGAEGVHLGQEDVPLVVARKILGPRAIIGQSCQSLDHCRRAEAHGADYIGFGSIFKTLTKPQRHPLELSLLTKAIEQTKIPVFAIGGIDENNIQGLIYLGVRRVAVTRAICEARDIRAVTKKLKNILGD